MQLNLRGNSGILILGDGRAAHVDMSKDSDRKNVSAMILHQLGLKAPEDQPQA